MCWRRLLRILLNARRSNHSILKEINPEYSSEGLMLKLKLQYVGHLMWRAVSLGKTLMPGKTVGRKSATEDEMVGWHYQLNGCEFGQTLGDSEGQGSLVCCSPCVPKSQKWLSEWTKTLHSFRCNYKWDCLLNSLYDYLLLVYGNATYFCVSILCSITLLNLFISCNRVLMNPQISLYIISCHWQADAIYFFLLNLVTIFIFLA